MRTNCYADVSSAYAQWYSEKRDFRRNALRCCTSNLGSRNKISGCKLLLPSHWQLFIWFSPPRLPTGTPETIVPWPTGSSYRPLKRAKRDLWWKHTPDSSRQPCSSTIWGDPTSSFKWLQLTTTGKGWAGKRTCW